MKKKGAPEKGAPKEAPPLPGSGPIATVAEGIPVGTAQLIRPVASKQDLIDAFKAFNQLKDDLLDPADYTWHVKYDGGGKEQRKVFVGTDGEKKAKKYAENLKQQSLNPEVEKRVRKSGCMKLSKAFGISTRIVDFFESRDQGVAIYRVAASAPNGQSRERTGSCDRSEKGKATMPFDNVSATANTRAEDRAIMALLGGENTSEEFEEHTDGEKDGKRNGAAGGPSPERDAGPPGEAGAPDPAKFSEEELERLKEIDRKFVNRKEAKPYDERSSLNARFWSMASRLFPGLPKDQLKEKGKQSIKALFKKESFKELTIEEYKTLVERAARKLNEKP